MKECTFQPQKVNGKTNKVGKVEKQELIDRLYRLDYIKKREMIKQMAQEQREIQEMDECSFKPKINQPYFTNTSNVSQQNSLPRGFIDSVGRMRQAQAINQKKKHQLEHIPTGENYQKIREQNIQPPSFLNKKK